jgi:hypothetical protein
VLARQTLTRQGVDAYIADQISGPKITPSDGSSGTLYSPTLALIKVAAMVDLGLSEEDVMDRPLRLTLWEVAVAAERRGDVHLAPTTDAFQGLLSASKAAQSAPKREEVPSGQ